jgi:acyl-CoA thioesterase-1
MGSVTNAALSRRLIAVFVLASIYAFAFPSATVAQSLRIVALGDSLTAGYGLTEREAFPVKLQAALKAKGHDVEVINAGVSGDTSTGGLARLDWSVPEKTDAVILELGANDALRAVDPSVTRKALDDAIAKLRGRKIEVLLTGMMAPPNFGGDYAARFNPIYPDLAKKHDVVFYPFFLDGVATVTKLNLKDGIHPTAEGIDLIVARILPKVEELIARVRANRK